MCCRAALCSWRTLRGPQGRLLRARWARYGSRKCALTIRSSRDRFAAAELFGKLSQRRGRKALRLNSGVRPQPELQRGPPCTWRSRQSPASRSLLARTPRCAPAFTKILRQVHQLARSPSANAHLAMVRGVARRRARPTLRFATRLRAIGFRGLAVTVPDLRFQQQAGAV